MQISAGRFSSPIAKISFEGWESDTMTLQRCGWDISARQISIRERHRPAIQLALRHEVLKLYALTNLVDINHSDFITLSQHIEAPFCFKVVTMGGDGQRIVISGDMPKVSLFQAVDAFPEYDYTSNVTHQMYLKDLAIFRTVPQDAPELVIDPNKVGEILDLILKAQDPRQAELREKKRREAWASEQKSGYNARSDIRAQIITLAG